VLTGGPGLAIGPSVIVVSVGSDTTSGTNVDWAGTSGIDGGVNITGGAGGGVGSGGAGGGVITAGLGGAGGLVAIALATFAAALPGADVSDAIGAGGGVGLVNGGTAGDVALPPPLITWLFLTDCFV
tara:strand:+ start:460 stop:840 length:381 start_codon:yes stop_codon:yes gene_type:complete